MNGEAEQQVIHYFKGDELGAARCGASVHPADHYRYSDRWPEVTCGGCCSHWSAPGSARLPAPDAAGIEAALAAGLAAHADWDYGGPGVIECEGCGWKSERLGPEWNSRKGDRHRAHVAAALLPVVTQAQAEALREAADAVEDECPMTWTPRDYRRDASDLTAEATDAALGEVYAGRDEALTEAELAEQDFDDWRWWREHTADRPDPWGDVPPPTPREHPPAPTDPPF